MLKPQIHYHLSILSQHQQTLKRRPDMQRPLVLLRRLHLPRYLPPNISQRTLNPFQDSPSRVSYTSSSGHGQAPLASFDPFLDKLEQDEFKPENERGGAGVRTYFDPVHGTLVTEKLQETDKSEGSIEQSEEEPDSVWLRESKRFRNGVGMEKERVNGVKVLNDSTEEGEEETRARVGRTRKDKEENDKGHLAGKAWSAIAKKKGKSKVSFVCEICGNNYSQWWGMCRSCGGVGSLKEFKEISELPEVNRARGADVSEAVVRSWLPPKLGELVPKSLNEVNKGRDQSQWRIPLSGLFGMEVSRVLGGGLVPGSLVLVGGDPGVGKSTLLLQLAAIIAEGFNTTEPAKVLYVSGEESLEQIGNRADRTRITTKNLYLYSSTDIEDIFDKIQPLSPRALIIDSIQTVYLRGIAGSAGNVMQVKECTSALLRFAKQTNIPVLLIGHVTKTGDIAGPRILEHIVDVVLYMEGERCSSYRLLRSVKNRFGSTDELGVFGMSEAGLQAISNPSEMFLTEHIVNSDILVGLAIAVVLDGSRTFLLEVQALCAQGSASTVKHVNGIESSRADLIISVLMKQAGLKIQNHTIFLNVVSGIKLSETAGDLAIAAAICSSVMERPIPTNIAFIGEVGLCGELRTVPRTDKRLIAVAKLGYKVCVVPKMSEKLLEGLNLDITILGCKNLKEMIVVLFPRIENENPCEQES